MSLYTVSQTAAHFQGLCTLPSISGSGDWSPKHYVLPGEKSATPGQTR